MGWAGDWEGNLVTSKAMVERYPNSPGGHAFLGAALMYLGRFEECVEPAKNSIRLSPRDQGIGTWKNQLALCYFFRGEYPKAIEYARAALQASPNMTQPQVVLAASLAREGRVAEARSIAAAFHERYPTYKTEQTVRAFAKLNPEVVEAGNRWAAALREAGLP